MTSKQRKQIEAKLALGLTPSYEEAGLEENFADAVRESQKLKARRDVLDERIADLRDGIRLRLEDDALRAVLVENFNVSLVDSVRSSIDRKKLLELGVSETIVLAATERKAIISLTIKELKH
jgi:hypothetical protein